jgi:predicted metal-dependent HD superfamily phosphohydrolase
MLFNVRYGCLEKGLTINQKKVTSTEVRKLLSNAGLSVKEAKGYVSSAIKAFFADRKTYEVAGEPYVTVVKSSVDKKVLERHRIMVAEKIKRRKEAEERAAEQDRKAKCEKNKKEA